MAKFQYYKDIGGRWRWRLRNDEEKIIATSSEGFGDKQECFDSINAVKQLSGISEVRIYESEDEFVIYKEAEESAPIEKALESEPVPEIEPEPTIELEPEPKSESESEPEVKEPKPIKPNIPEEKPDQPADIPPIMKESDFTTVPPKWKKPNWALITSIASVVVIIILIILFSMRDKPEPEKVTLEIISDVMETDIVTDETPIVIAEDTARVIIETEPEASELEAIVESPELSKLQEPLAMDIYHKVVKGDRLWSLADEYYSDSYLWPNIYNANTEKIRNPDILRLGIELLIPALEGSYLKLSEQDRHKVAVGYIRAYLIYKKLGKTDAKYYLWAVQLYDPAVLSNFQGQIDLEDLQAIESFKKH
ncbi:MAG: DUF1508 domain-containing protein [Candidatus Marinimicrobia bacterium]|nr:DUF1508 domain-containing protein [Candidatus Neomarinimicrobiota bacterium]